ncbi:DUF2269 domain-containing protein [Streptomyces sp. NPDC086766]|uniref:DUF2269 domain-containing protein n=1 Tax=Streptomyces sp. NPDC086766 TaxID=3365754 RepID=UPI0038098B23
MTDVGAGPTSPRPFRLGRRGRQITLIMHLVSSVAWLGLDIILLTLGIAAANDASTRHARYLAMQLLIDTLLLPLGLLSIATGLLLVVGGRWGLLRHKWVGTKFLLSVASVAAAWLALRPRVDTAVAVSLRPGTAKALFSSAYAPGWMLVIAPSVGCVLYLTATVLGVMKPGRRPTRS